MAPSITPELWGEFMGALLAACPPARWAGSAALCAPLEREDTHQPEDPDAAEVELRMKLEHDPDDIEVLCALDRLHQRVRGRSAELIAVLRGRLDLAGDSGERWQLLLRLGMLHGAAGSETELRRVIRALQALPRPSGVGAS